jgi:hypothetical protein
MDRDYTLAEIARITGIPLEELEQYEREFADLLPRPRCCPAVPGPPVERQPPVEHAASERRRAGQRSRIASWRRLCQACGAAVRRLRGWPLLACGARILVWWKKWRQAFEPA